MLQAIRSKAGSVVVKGLFAVLIVTFGIWGIGDIFRNQAPGTVVATIDGAGIDADALQSALRPTLERLSMQTGSPVDFQQAKRLGIVDEVLGRLIDRGLVDRQAAQLRLDVSDEVLRGVIARNPDFRGANGAFDRNIFSAVLAANHLTEDQYVAQLRGEIPRADLMLAVTAGVAPPASLVDFLYQYRDQKRVADIVSLPTAGAGDVGQPSDAELEAFYNSHKNLFRAPEFRGFALASLSPSEIAQGIDVPEAKLKEQYDQRRGDFVVPERRDVEQILAPSEDKAKAAVAALAAGKDWRTVAASIAGQAPDTIDLGLLKREELPAALADAAFALPLDKPSQPIKSALGWHILRVVKIEPPATQTFAEAKAKLAAAVAHDEAVERIYKIANHVDDALAGGATIEEAAAKFGLKKTAVAAVDAEGKGRDGKRVALPIAPDAVIKLAFATEQGQISRVTETEDDALYVLRTDKVAPPATKPLAEVRDAAIAAWQAEKRAAIVAKQAAALAASVKPGTRLAAAANAKGLKVATSPAFLRRATEGNTVPAALVDKLFAVKSDGVVTATDPTGAHVAQLDTIEEPGSGPAAAAAKAQLSRELTAGSQADLSAEFTRALRAQFPVEIHHETLDRLF